MIRITIEGHGHEKVAKSVYNLLIMERKIVRHYKEGPPDHSQPCDVELIEIKDKTGE